MVQLAHTAAQMDIIDANSVKGFVVNFTEETKPSPSTFGVGPLWIEGLEFFSDGTRFVPTNTGTILYPRDLMSLTGDHFEDETTFTTNGGEAAGSNTNIVDDGPVRGDSIKLTITADGARQLNKAVAMTNADISTGWFGQWVKVNDISLLDSMAQFIFMDGAGGFYQRFPKLNVAANQDDRIADEWRLLFWTGGEMAAGGGALAFASNVDNVVSIRFGISVGLAGLELTMGPLVYSAKTKPTIVFCFDDSNDSDITTALPVLEQHGFVGTTFTIASLIGTANSLSNTDLTTLKRAGWTIGVHGEFSHFDTFADDLTMITDDVKLNRDFIIDNGHGSGEYYTYPLGHYTPNSIIALRNLGFKYAGSTHARGWPVIPGLNPLALGRVGTSGLTLLQLTDRVDQTITEGGSVSFFSHIVAPGQSGIHTDLAIFEGLVEYVAKKQNEGLIDAGLNMEDVMNRYTS